MSVDRITGDGTGLTGVLKTANNLSDVASASAAAHSLGLGTADSPTFTGLAVGTRTVASVNRSLTATLHDTVEIGNIVSSWGAGTIRISVIVASSGYSFAATYVIPWQYNIGAATWYTVQPRLTTAAFGSNSVALEIEVSGGTFYLRLRNSGAGATAGTAYVTLEMDGSTTVFTATSATTTGGTPSPAGYTITTASLISGNGAVQGVSTWSGSGAPSNSLGSDGDIYINSAGGSLTTIYQRRSGSYVGIV